MEINYPAGKGPGTPLFDARPVLIPIVLLFFAVVAAGTMFYQIGPDEVGVVQRFGKYVRTTSPGLQWKLPFGVETVKRVKITYIYKEEFGFRTMMTGTRTYYAGQDTRVPMKQSVTQRFDSAETSEESLMLTGDLNVAEVEWIVQYTIKDPVQFAFRVRNPRETIRNMSEAVMRLVVGDNHINHVLTSGREEIQNQAERMLQEVLDSYGSGVAIRNVILQDVNPPDKVKPSFNEVNEARQEKEKAINQAWEEYNHVIPKAKGQAEQVIREAEGYALERINRAKGDADRFLLTYEAYKNAPAVTKRRLYLEMAEKVFPQLGDKWILDSSQESILPLLKLNAEKGGE